MTPEQKKLFETYAALPPVPCAMVEILSVLERSLSRMEVIKCLNKAGFRTPKGKTFSHASSWRLFRNLVEKGLLADSDRRLRCRSEIKELIARETARAGRFARWVEIVSSAIHRRRYRAKDHYYGYSRLEITEELRIAIHLNKAEAFEQLLYRWSAKFSTRSLVDLYEDVFNDPFDAEWVKSRAELIRDSVLHHLVSRATRHLLPAREPVDLLRALEEESEEAMWRRRLIATHDLLAGDFERAVEWMPTDSVNFQLMRGWERCARGDRETAVAHFETAIALIKKQTRKRDIALDPLAGAFYVLALLGTGDQGRIPKARKYVEVALRKHPEDLSLLVALRCAADFAEGKTQRAGELSGQLDRVGSEPTVHQLFIFTALCWVDVKAAGKELAAIRRLKIQAEEGGYCWVAAEFARLLGKLRPQEAESDAPPKGHREMGSAPIFDTIREEPPWERSLAALEQLSKTVKRRRKPAKTSSRLTWRLIGTDRPEALLPFEQKLSKNGKWTRGRAVSLKRLHKRTKTAFITAQDVRICEAIDVFSWRSREDYDLLVEKALDPLVGHPLVFRADDPSTRVEVVRAEPHLRVTAQGREVRITLLPAPPDDGDVEAVFETPTRLVVTTFGEEHGEIFSLLGEEGLAAPVGSKDRVVRAVSSVSSLVTVHSDIAGGDTDAKDVDSDATPHFFLTPYEEGLRVEPLVQPFVGEGPTYPPGKGGEVVFAIVGRRRARTRRDRPEEVRRFDRAVSSCPSLHHASWDGTAWILPDPMACLELLEELHLLGDKVVVRWPQGESMKIKHRASPDRLSLKIRKSRDWFKIEGDLQTESGLVMGLRELLDRIDAAEGRFLPIGEREFVALTERFRRRVEELAAFVDRHGKGLRFHPSRAHALEALIEDAGSVDAGREWAARIRRFREAQALDPKVPSTLQADLRDYQAQGFRWAARLAAWGAGACLADDMGLGKTVQALTVALVRAPSGPTLAVAPTSVCPNWIDEARRFTPTLNPFQFGPGDRAKMIAALAPYDLMVCSYGLLHQEADRLAEVEWETIVLDEAQAIKNRDTLRSRAAMRLNGAFRMITTGTPIENHLGELWNLFHFINPGLLGSAGSFSKRFAVPIHQAGSTDARSRLKRLIQPFILRRTKSAVLDELPPRTEITIRVEMSAEERALYEAVRQRAVENVTEEDSGNGRGHIRILAEIMKLRRACCHPRLIAPDWDLASSKLESFGYTVADLIASGHKALVFSQFVDHLKIVRSHLDREGVAYRYLDGSTPSRQRKREVDAFQAGEGDLFLISLRAGGQGLNLTAADYVLHLDPWWNPAVEDQASDRAHRIGQTRPVTIYRFVMKHTIEEKIVDLHASKRDLANNLLEGADMSGKMSADELLALIRVG